MYAFGLQSEAKGTQQITKHTLVSHLLAPGKLELGSPEGFNDSILVFVVSSYGHEGLSNPDAGNCSLGFAEGATHSCLQPISSRARQHLVDSKNMIWVNTDANVELILCRIFYHVLQIQVFRLNEIKAFKAFQICKLATIRKKLELSFGDHRCFTI